jgi:hypothetical protein
MGQLGGSNKQRNNVEDSATSSAFMGQFGGSNKQNGENSNKDINKLISMLTTESSANKINNLSETTTESLEAQLREILKQDGGSKKYKKTQTAGSNVSNIGVEDIRGFFTNLKSQGVDFNVQLNDKSLSDFFGLVQNTTTDMSDFNLEKMKGGSKKKSKKEQKQTIKKEELDGGTNAGFQAFADFKKYVATKLKISNGVPAVKIAASVNKKMKEMHSDLGPTELIKKNMEYFDKNISKIKDEFKELIEKSSAKK